MDGNTSSLVKLIKVVPRDSVLGPLLFVLDATDVMKIAQNHGVIYILQKTCKTYISCKFLDQNALSDSVVCHRWLVVFK